MPRVLNVERILGVFQEREEGAGGKSGRFVFGEGDDAVGIVDHVGIPVEGQVGRRSLGQILNLGLWEGVECGWAEDRKEEEGRSVEERLEIHLFWLRIESAAFQTGISRR